MAKNYLVVFGSGSPATNTGLAPTFTVFKTTPGGTNATPPGITEIPTATGLYYFTYGPTNTIGFVIDGATTGLSSSNRYVPGVLDPADAIDEQLSQVGSSMIAGFTYLGSSIMLGLTGLGQSLAFGFTSIGQSLIFGFTSIDAKIGATTSSFGTTSTDPGTVFGYLKRALEFNEGNSTFAKSSGVWSILSRGSSTQIASKTLADSAGTVTKT